MKNILLRFRSWALWLSLAALIVFCVKELYGLDISKGVNGFMNVLLPVLVAFGIVNNPTDSKGI
ncbi:MAG: phage holin [Ruminococcaceae bacterium]|nr:phage holin [Oscillospiraceae bacterium]